MTKKLQQDSVWAKYDIDNDGTVSDEELERATQMIELDLREEARLSKANSLGSNVLNGVVFTIAFISFRARRAPRNLVFSKRYVVP